MPSACYLKNKLTAVPFIALNSFVPALLRLNLWHFYSQDLLAKRNTTYLDVLKELKDNYLVRITF